MKKEGGFARAQREALMSSSHWITVKNSLTEKGLIGKLEEKEAAYGSQGERGRKRNLYGLTLKGLATAFRTMKSSNDMDRIADKCGHLLPLVIGKWGHFKSAGLEEESILEAFKWVIMWILEYGHNRAVYATERFWEFIFRMTSITDRIRWVKALRTDPQLRQWVIKETRFQIAEGIIFLEMHNNILQAIEMAGEPDLNKLASVLPYSFERVKEFHLEFFGEDLLSVLG